MHQFKFVLLLVLSIIISKPACCSISETTTTSSGTMQVLNNFRAKFPIDEMKKLLENSGSSELYPQVLSLSVNLLDQSTTLPAPFFNAVDRLLCLTIDTIDARQLFGLLEHLQKMTDPEKELSTEEDERLSNTIHKAIHESILRQSKGSYEPIYSGNVVFLGRVTLKTMALYTLGYSLPVSIVTEAASSATRLVGKHIVQDLAVRTTNDVYAKIVDGEEVSLSSLDLNTNPGIRKVTLVNNCFELIIPFAILYSILSDPTANLKNFFTFIAAVCQICLFFNHFERFG